MNKLTTRTHPCHLGPVPEVGLDLSFGRTQFSLRLEHLGAGQFFVYLQRYIKFNRYIKCALTRTISLCLVAVSNMACRWADRSLALCFTLKKTNMAIISKDFDCTHFCGSFARAVERRVSSRSSAGLSSCPGTRMEEWDTHEGEDAAIAAGPSAKRRRLARACNIRSCKTGQLVLK